jgi:hypothetical protein
MQKGNCMKKFPEIDITAIAVTSEPLRSGDAALILRADGSVEFAAPGLTNKVVSNGDADEQVYRVLMVLAGAKLMGQSELMRPSMEMVFDQMQSAVGMLGGATH